MQPIPDTSIPVANVPINQNTINNNKKNKNNKNNLNQNNNVDVLENEANSLTNLNKNVVGNNINNIDNSTSNPLIEKFKEFVNTYAKVDKIDANVIEIVNAAFKSYDKFSKDIASEASLRISETDFEEFCVNNINDKSMISLSLKDENLGEFIKVYKDLKAVYLDNCEYLLGLLENKVLVKSPINDKDENPSFTLQNIGFNDLVSLETDVRNRLVNMYSKCQEHYQQGIVALYNALKTKVE